MIAILVGVLRAQWRAVLTVFGLALLAVGAAVAAPVYTAMAGRAIAASDIGAAPSNQRTITASDYLILRVEPGNHSQEFLAEEARRRDFEHVAPALLDTPGFELAHSVSVPAYVTDAAKPGEKSDDKNGELEFRDGFCDHVVVLAGRCVVAPGEAMVTERRGLGPNTTASITAAIFVSGGPNEPGFWVPGGEPCRLAVVGVYRPRDPADLYWGGSAAALTVAGQEPVLTDRATIAACDHPEEVQEVVAYPAAGTLAVARIDAVRADVRSTVERARGRIGARTDIEALLNAMSADGKTVALVPATAAVPLLALCWFVLFLAIAATANARRPELGIVKLRGVTTSDQWMLAAAESLLPLFAGGAAGYVVGHLAVGLYGRIVFGPTATAPLTAGAWPYAAVAVTGAVVAAAVALRRDLSASATDLLRRVPARTRRWGDVALALLVAAAAAVCVVQLRGQPGPPGGLGLAAPALALLALGLFAAVALDPVAARVGRLAVSSGRTGLAVAALHIGRRRTASRLLAVIVVAVGLLAFAAMAAGTAAAAREAQVSAAIGANRVLSVAEVTPIGLLSAVRSVDPDGRFAMAAVAVDQPQSGRRVLAVDTTRLATAALWPAANENLSAAAASAALRPTTPPPVTVRGRDLAVTVDVTAFEVRPATSSLRLQVAVTPADGSASLLRDLGDLRPGRNTYRVDAPCAVGCRVAGIGIAPNGPVDGSFRLTVRSVSSGPDQSTVDGIVLAGWQSLDPAVPIRSGPEGIELSATSVAFEGIRVVPADVVVPLPMLDAASTLPPALTLTTSGVRVPVTRGGDVRSLPRLGTGGGLVDLEYLGRFGDVTVPGRSGEIWLGPQAPADAAERFRAAGLRIAGERRFDDELAAAARRPISAGVRFLLVVAVLGLVLGAAGLIVAASVERPQRTLELRSLRAQGLSRRRVRWVAGLGYVGLVGLGSVLGALAATVVWTLTGDRLPVVEGDAVVAVFPGLALLATAAGAGILGLTALGLASILVRTVERPLRSVR